MPSDNVLDVVEDLRRLVTELRRLLYGEPPRVLGMVAEFDAQTRRIQELEKEVAKLKSRRASPLMFTAGYVSILTAIAFTTISAVNFASDSNVLDIPWLLAGGLAIILYVAALPMLIGGFGWWEAR